MTPITNNSVPKVATKVTGTLQNLAKFFREGNKSKVSAQQPSQPVKTPSHLNIKISIPPPTYLCQDILVALTERGEATEVEINSPHSPIPLNFSIREVNNRVELAANAECSQLLLEETSLAQLHKNIIYQLILQNTNSAVSPVVVCNVLKHMMERLEREVNEFKLHSQFYEEVMAYIINEDNNIVTQELKIIAIKHIFKYVDSESFLLVVAEKAIQLSSESHILHVADAAKSIMELGTKKYDDVFMMSASIYIFIYPYKFSPSILVRAAKHLFINGADCPVGFISKAASAFVKQNYLFFKGPLIDQIASIKNGNPDQALSPLEKYAYEFKEVLTLEDYKTPVDIQYPGSQELIFRELTVLELWCHEYVDEALKNEEVCHFLLENIEHEAITEWIQSTQNTPTCEDDRSLALQLTN